MLVLEKPLLQNVSIAMYKVNEELEIKNSTRQFFTDE